MDGLRHNIATISNKVNDMLNYIVNDLAYLHIVRSQGNAYIANKGIGGNSGQQIIFCLNNPTGSGLTRYLYNLQISFGDLSTSQSSLHAHIRLLFCQGASSGGNAHPYLNLKLNGTQLSNVNTLSYGGTVSPTNYNATDMFIRNGDYYVDFQEENIEIPPGFSLVVLYIRSTIDVNTQIRWYEKNN